MMMIHTFLCCHKASEAVKYHAAEVATTFGLTDVAKLCGTGNTKPDVLKWIVTNIEQHCCGRYSWAFLLCIWLLCMWQVLVIIDAEPKDRNIGLPTEAYIAVEEVHDVSVTCQCGYLFICHLLLLQVAHHIQYAVVHR